MFFQSSHDVGGGGRGGGDIYDNGRDSVSGEGGERWCVGRAFGR